MVWNRLFVFSAISLLCFSVFSQHPLEIGSVEEVIEDISENSEEETDYTSLLEDLWCFSQYPININTCTGDELAKLHLLTGYQINSLLEYIRTRGPLTSIYEIQYIYGFNKQLAGKLEPFITIGAQKLISDVSAGELLKYGRHELYITGTMCLQKKAGYVGLPDTVLSVNPDKSHYLGDPYKIKAKYTYQYRQKVMLGIQAEKDAGEEFFRGNNPAGFDFYSGYLQVNDLGPVKNIIIGDYYLQFGQGLTLYSGLAFGKSAFSTDVAKRVTGIRKYGSADENCFFRGIASTVTFKKIELTGFISKKAVDANYTDTLENGDDEFSSFQSSGNHRTPLEIEDERAIGEIAAGVNVQYKAEKFRLGATMVNYQFSGVFNPADKLYNKYNFRGSSLVNAGIDYRYRRNKIEIFGETSFANNSWATLNGILLYPAELVSFSMLYRNYSKAFFAYRNNPFSEYASKNNEKGLYFGTTIYPLRHVKLTAYYDAFKSPWLRYNVSAPSSGNDYLVQVNYSPGRSTEFTVRFKSEVKAKNHNSDTIPVAVVKDFKVHKLRMNAGYPVCKNITFRNRLEYNIFDQEEDPKESGWYLSHDVIYTGGKIPLSFWLRLAVFNCKSYDTRVYAYENTMPYSFSVPFFYNHGTRFYAMLKWSVNSHSTIWIRYAVTMYRDRESIGTGLDEIKGNIDSDAEVMIKFRL